MTLPRQSIKLASPGFGEPKPAGWISRPHGSPAAQEVEAVIDRICMIHCAEWMRSDVPGMPDRATWKLMHCGREAFVNGNRSVDRIAEDVIGFLVDAENRPG